MHDETIPEILTEYVPLAKGVNGETVDLLAGQHIKIGVVEVSNDADYIYIQYQITEADWCITATHLHIGEGLDDFPFAGRSGNPVPGRFDYSGKHDCLQTVEYETPLGEWEAGQQLIIAAHAEVVQGQKKESGWAAGERFTPRGNWATYFEYTVVEDFTCGDPITDIDGNVYQTVQIGDQCWMAENLKVSRYQNGDDIPTGLSNTDWRNTTSGAFAIYPHTAVDGIDSDEEMVDAYGKLYNWYAVDDDRGLCPEGWHVPTDAEWTALVDYVVAQGYPNTNVVGGAGNALKSRRQVDNPLDGGIWATSEHPRWHSHSTHHGLDVFGFSGLPGGSRGSYGYYGYFGIYGGWWSSSEYSTYGAWYRYLYHGYGNVPRSIDDKRHGFSVRCLRDD